MQVTINRDGQQYGPYPIEDAAAHLATGGLLPTDWAWAEGMTDWAPLGEVVAAMQAPAPVAAPVQPVATQPEVQPVAASPAAVQPIMAAQPAAAASPAAVQPMAAQPAAAVSPAAVQPMATQPAAAVSPAAVQPMAAQPVAAASPAAVQPMAAQPTAQLASPSQLSTTPSLASPSNLNTSPAAAAVPKAEKADSPKPQAGSSGSGLKGLFAGNKKLIFAVCGIVISAVLIGMQLTGGDEEINIEKVEVNEPAANTAESELQKLGAQFDYDVNEQISSVTIQEKPITQAQFRLLLEFKNLQRISLVKCGIDDAALQGLKGLTKLSFLDVSGNPKVTDGCIDTLSTIKTLSTLNASDTGITSVGEEKLKEALPDCNVTIKAASAEPAK
jgi:hypothetical protein